MKSAELVNTTSSASIELICIDYLSFERSKRGHENILVIIDHFARYAQAIPARNQSANTTAIFSKISLSIMAFLKTIHSDMDANFESFVILQVSKRQGQPQFIQWEMAWWIDST